MIFPPHYCILYFFNQFKSNPFHSILSLWDWVLKVYFWSDCFHWLHFRDDRDIATCISMHIEFPRILDPYTTKLCVLRQKPCIKRSRQITSVIRQHINNDNSISKWQINTHGLLKTATKYSSSLWRDFFPLFFLFWKAAKWGIRRHFLQTMFN